MEASAAGQAAAGDAGQQGDADAGAPGVDLAPLTQQLEATAATQEQTFQLLQQLVQNQPEPEAEPEPDPFGQTDFSFLEGEPGIDPQQFQQTLQAGIQELVQQQVQQQVAPLSQQVQEQRLAAEYSALEGEFPELADPATARSVLDLSHQMVEANGWDPSLAASPAMVRLVFMAGRAAESAQQEGGNPPPAALESGVGARPGTSSSEELGRQITEPEGRKGRAALPY